MQEQYSVRTDRPGDSRPCNGSYLFVVPWDIRPPGGVNHVVTNLFHQVARGERYNPILLINSWQHRVPTEKILEGRSTIFYRLRSPLSKGAGLKAAIAFVVYLPMSLFQLTSLLKDNDVRVINIHYPGLYALYLGLLRKFRLYQGRLILSFHGMDIWTASHSNPTKQLLWKFLLSTADDIVTCSRSLQQQVVDFSPKCRDRTHAIHNGIDLGLIAMERDEGAALPKELIGAQFILTIGTFERKKGHDVLLAAFQRVVDDFPNIVLVLIGKPGDTIQPLRREIHDAGLCNRVIIYENVPHSGIWAFLEAATLFVLPSRREPFGIVVLEAGFLGNVVVATNVGGIPEIIKHGESGRLVESEDTNILAQEIVHLLEHPDECRRLGEALRRRVIERFTWESAYKAYMDVANDSADDSD